MPIFHKNRQNLQSAKTDKSQQILQEKTQENHLIFCQNLENAVEPKTKKTAFFATKKSTPINKKHPQKNLTSNQAQTPPAPRKKFLKIFAAASLALITCATTLLATTPFGAGTASAATNSNLSNNTQTTSPLGLDPENDPVVFTTSSGIDIKYGGAGFPTGTLESSGLSGYAYVTMGGRNWVIIGQSENGFSSAFAVQAYANGWATSQYADITSAAGNAMYSDLNFLAFSEVYGDIPGTISYTFPNVVATAELDQNELLCFCETSLTRMAFGSLPYTNSAVKTYLTDYYNNILTATERRSIVNKTLISTAFYDTGNVSHNEYLFLLAGTVSSSNSAFKNQTFKIDTYITTAGKRVINEFSGIEKVYWLRTVASSTTSGNPYVAQIDAGGQVSTATFNSGSTCSGCANTGKLQIVRPAFVLSLTQ